MVDLDLIVAGAEAATGLYVMSNCLTNVAYETTKGFGRAIGQGISDGLIELGNKVLPQEITSQRRYEDAKQLTKSMGYTLLGVGGFVTYMHGAFNIATAVTDKF